MVFPECLRESAGPARKAPEPMPIQPGSHCRSCLETMLLAAVRMACTDRPSQDVERILTGARRRLDEGFAQCLPPPRIAGGILRSIRAESGNPDPYAAVKELEMELACEHFNLLRRFLDDSFRSAVILAALGNSLDYFKTPAEAMEELKVFDGASFRFHVDHVSALETVLARSRRSVVYLTDNAGEIHFDLPLVQRLVRDGHDVTVCPKGGPALNDLTEEDLRRSGLDGALPRILSTGMDAPGIDLEGASGEFRHALDAADLVISKGMANFETLDPWNRPGRILYLFKVKCPTLSDHLRSPIGSYFALLEDGAGVDA